MSLRCQSGHRRLVGVKSHLEMLRLMLEGCLLTLSALALFFGICNKAQAFLLELLCLASELLGTEFKLSFMSIFKLTELGGLFISEIDSTRIPFRWPRGKTAALRRLYRSLAYR